MSAADNDDIIIAGQLGGPYGVRGWIKVVSHTDTKENLLSMLPWMLKIKGNWQACDVEDAKVHGKGLIAKIKGIDSPEQAKTFVNTPLAIYASQLPELGDDEYYWQDLIGLHVYNEQDQYFGTIKTLIETGANDVMQVMGDRERLIPYIDDVVLGVDLCEGRMQVAWDADF